MNCTAPPSGMESMVLPNTSKVVRPTHTTPARASIKFSTLLLLNVLGNTLAWCYATSERWAARWLWYNHQIERHLNLFVISSHWDPNQRFRRLRLIAYGIWKQRKDYLCKRHNRPRKWIIPPPWNRKGTNIPTFFVPLPGRQGTPWSLARAHFAVTNPRLTTICLPLFFRAKFHFSYFRYSLRPGRSKTQEKTARMDEATALVPLLSAAVQDKEQHEELGEVGEDDTKWDQERERRMNIETNLAKLEELGLSPAVVRIHSLFLRLAPRQKTKIIVNEFQNLLRCYDNINALHVPYNPTSVGKTTFVPTARLTKVALFLAPTSLDCCYLSMFPINLNPCSVYLAEEEACTALKAPSESTTSSCARFLQPRQIEWIHNQASQQRKRDDTGGRRRGGWRRL